MVPRHFERVLSLTTFHGNAGDAVDALKFSHDERSARRKFGIEPSLPSRMVHRTPVLLESGAWTAR